MASPAIVAQVVATTVEKKASFKDNHVAFWTKVFRAASSYQLRPKWEKTVTDRSALNEKKMTSISGKYSATRQKVAIAVNPGRRLTSKCSRFLMASNSAIRVVPGFIPDIDDEGHHDQGHQK